MRYHFETAIGGRPVGWLETVEEALWRVEDIIGTPGDDTLRGGDGDDVIDGREGADRMAGGLGNDTYYVDNPGDVVREKRDAGTDTVVSSIDWTLGKHVENLTLAEGLADLKGTGNHLANLITDNSGSNLIDGAAGNDTLDGGRIVAPGDADTLVGGTGEDLLLAGRLYYSTDLLDGGAGNDTLHATLGSCQLYGGDGDDLLDGGQGGYHQGNGYLYGGAGSDTLSGGVLMDGGDGNDLLQSTVSASKAIGGAGHDTIRGAGGAGYNNYSVDAGSGDDLVDVTSVNNSLTIVGGEGDDSLTGSAAINVAIDGGLGDDWIQGIKSGSGAMALTGGDGNDTLSGFGGHGNTTLDGGAGNDVLTASGGSGTNLLLKGGLGDDTLSAGSGVATLWGGGDHNLYILQTREVQGVNSVVVMDYIHGFDHLGVSQSALPVGNRDLVVDGATTTTGPGGFDSSAELVVVTADIAGAFSLDKAAAAIGSANQAYTAGQTSVFVVDNGSDSWALYFQSSGADAAVSAAELSIIGRVGFTGTGSMTVDDLWWTG